MDFSGSGTNLEIVHLSSVLPGYVPHLTLLFKLIATMVNLSFVCWVIFTIKITRSLCKSHNIFLANVLISDMVSTLLGTLMTSAIMISYQLGMDSPFSCYALQLQILPFYVNIWSFVILAVDKVIAVTFPFKHKRMVTPLVTGTVIGGTWLLAVIVTAFFITNHADDVISVPEFGVCVHEGIGFIDLIVFALMPALVTTILTIILNIYLALKAYQVQKQIENETRLAGHNIQSDNLKALKKKQRNIRRNRKPIITLLVVISGQALIDLFFVPFHVLGRYFIDTQGYHELMNYVIFYNMGYVLQFYTLLVYGLQIREPMMKRLKRWLRINNSVAPQP